MRNHSCLEKSSRKARADDLNLMGNGVGGISAVWDDGNLKA